MVICLSHSGTWKDKRISEDEILAKEVPGIDVIISGHTHSVLNPYIRVGNTYIVSADCYARYLGRLVVARKSDGSFQVLNYKLIPITSALSDDSRIAGLVKSFEKYIDAEYLKQFNYYYGEVVAKSAFSLPDPDWDKSPNRAECLTSGLGDLVGDAFRYAVKKKEGKNYRNISFVFEGFGQIRVPLAKGPLTVNDVFRLMALGIGPDGKVGSGLVVFWLNGNEIKKILELETTFAPVKHDLHLQVTGMRFSYDPKAEPFNRVKKVEVETDDGRLDSLENNRLYRVCTNWKTLVMRQKLDDLTGGKIRFVPKDESGKPLNDMKASRIFIDNTKSLELKEWLAVAMYLQSLSDLPLKYRSAEKNISF
jgi:2',3'-cyclic-nucleotide 2'-phosphodiesterase (5'-nucleotidase family)